MGKLDELISDLEKVKKSLNDLDRGIYGDDKNEVPGLLHVVNHLKETIRLIQDEIKKIKDARKADKLKVVSFGMGAGTIIGIIGWIIEHFLIK